MLNILEYLWEICISSPENFQFLLITTFLSFLFFGWRGVGDCHNSLLLILISYLNIIKNIFSSVLESVIYPIYCIGAFELHLIPFVHLWNYVLCY